LCCSRGTDLSRKVDIARWEPDEPSSVTKIREYSAYAITQVALRVEMMDGLWKKLDGIVGNGTIFRLVTHRMMNESERSH
jgi:hypothetical protein